MEKYLSIDGFGDVHEAHFESGLVLAVAYFSENDLDFIECYKAFKNNEKSELSKHWTVAESKANLALYGFNLQDNSMLVLNVVNEQLE